MVEDCGDRGLFAIGHEALVKILFPFPLVTAKLICDYFYKR
jgi:hypothetical protein